MRPWPSAAKSSVAGATIVVLAALLAGAPARAEGDWKPFAEKDAALAKRPQPAPTKPLLPAFSDPAPTPTDRPADPAPAWQQAAPSAAPATAKANAVERSELAPVMAADGTNLPVDLWNGLDLPTLEAQLAKLDIPPRSAAAGNLWRRLLQAEVAGPGGAGARFQAVRAEAYLRSGLLKEQAEALAKVQSADAVVTAMRARADIALGNSDTGCPAVKEAAARKADLPKRLNGEIIVLAGYCAAIAGNHAAAGLAAELAREENLDAPLALAALDAIAAGKVAAAKTKVALPKRLDAIEYRLIELTAPPEPGSILEKADPSLLALLVASDRTEPKLRLAAAEAAARLNIIAPERLGEIYRLFQFQPHEMADPMAGRPDPLTRRALLLKAAEAERTPQKKTRALRALLDDARRNGLYLPMLRLAAKPIATLQRQVEIGWFAETAVEAMLAAERYDDARAWVAFGEQMGRAVPAAPATGLQHWLALIDLADPANRGVQRGQSLASVEQMALAGRFQPDMLHRIATVLDALDYQVPLPLWEAASRTPQPSTGHLPETGVLTELQDAAKKREFGRTVLLVLRTLGPNGAEGAHMIALGDAVRGLKRAGLEPDARRIAFEALFAGWPRATS